MTKNELERLASSGSRIDAIVAVIGEFSEDLHRDHCEALDVARFLAKNMTAQAEPLFDPDDGEVKLVPSEVGLREQFKMVRAALRENFSEEKIRFACQLIDLMRCDNTSKQSASTLSGLASSTKADKRGESRKNCAAADINELYGKAADEDQKLSVVDMKVAIIGELSNDRKRGVPQSLKMADEAAEQLQKHGVTLYDKDDGEFPVCIVSPGMATEEEFNKLRAALRENFSREKLQRAIWVIRDLRDQRNSNFSVKAKILSDKCLDASCPNQETESKGNEPSPHGSKMRHLGAMIWTAIVIAIGVIVAAIIKFI